MRRYGHVRQTWWARAQLVDTAFESGRWDEALEHVEAVIAYVEAGNPQYAEAELPPRPCRHQVRTRGRRRVRARDPPIARARSEGNRPSGERRPSPSTPRISACGQAIAGRAASARLDARDGADERSRVDLIHYEAALLAALLDLDPAELGVTASRGRQHTAPACHRCAARRRPPRRSRRARGAREGERRGVPPPARRGGICSPRVERTKGERRSSGRSTSTAASALRGSIAEAESLLAGAQRESA